MPLNDFVFWIDANLPFKAVYWLQDKFGVHAEHVYKLGLLSAGDVTIYEAAIKSNQSVIIITKDEDFADLALRRKTYPKVIWITAGNLSNNDLQHILLTHFETAVEKLQNPEHYFIEIR